MSLDRQIEVEARWTMFRRLSPYFGKVISARFIQKTEEVLPGITRIHNLIEGIYKSKDAYFGLSIASMLKNPYADQLNYNQDRSWYFFYSPKKGALNSAVNQSLFNCMRYNEPILVLKQLTDNGNRNKGTTYRMLGLGMIEAFDDASRLFRIRQMSVEAIQARLNPDQDVLADDLIETALQLEALEQWSPVVAEGRAVYQVSKVKRDSAFRKIVLGNYADTCAVTGTKFVHENVIEAEAAHIIGKEVNGTDDPRNGIALSHTVHWAFDQGLFTLSDQYEVIVHPKAVSADAKLFPLLDRNGVQINLPEEVSFFPHQEALGWHRKEVYGRFAR